MNGNKEKRFEGQMTQRINAGKRKKKNKNVGRRGGGNKGEVLKSSEHNQRVYAC